MKRVVASLAMSASLLLGSQIPGKQANACCSLRHAEFSGTKGYVGEAWRQGKVVHLLAYQNNVLNLAVRQSRAARSAGAEPQAEDTGEGNAMLLPIPAKPGSMTRFNVVNSSTCPHILSDMARAVMPPRQGRMHMSHKGGGGAPAIQVFDSDIYTIVLAKNAKDIPAALSQVPADKRPAINAAIFSAYSRWYPKWTFALCCFNTTKKSSARPLIWWYEPKNKDELFFPAIDAHNGNPPDLTAEVAVDHVLAVGSRLLKFEGGEPVTSAQPDGIWTAPPTPPDDAQVRATASPDWKTVTYTDPNIAPDVQALLPQRVMGAVYHGLLPQGDFVFKTSDVRSGIFSMKRALPPGAPKS